MERPLIEILTYVTGEVHGRSVREALAVLAPSPALAQTGQVFAIESRGVIEGSALFAAGYQYWQATHRGHTLCRLSDLDAAQRVEIAHCVAFLDNDWELVQEFPSSLLGAFDALKSPFVKVAFPEFVYFGLVAEDDFFNGRTTLRTDFIEAGVVLLAEDRETALTEAHRRFLAERYGVDVSGEPVPVC